ncbi:hypothetical protein C2S53_016910 [Perilla frutescens var. hirtella]|uniref:Poly [ADP-ribose] polymerase n=1 Tax=Perilla frutescens var. hirtella TaxID=608512 RepID=A0AAD4J407_PERFH|nr:hypothetical protein C2S53_016910 [Perilla frutescens var. hirtella]
MSQPMEEYPNPEMSRQPDSSHSNGSFGPVFAVLAVIVVISAVACVLGRLCSKRSHRAKEAAQHSSKGSKQSKGLGPKEWESRQKPSFMKDVYFNLIFLYLTFCLMELERETQVSMTVDDYDPVADSDCESSPQSDSREFRDFSRNGMLRLERDHGEYGVIKRILGKELNVVAIHKNSYSTVTGQARLEAFRAFSQAVATKRGGDANIKYAWYGGSRDEVLGIVTHGFGRCGDFEDGVSHGIGVYLSPANVPFDCAMRAKEDENGVRHILLCRVILGNTETIAAGSRQFQPSCTDFDSGIDNPLSPTKYTIWSAYMNSHIFPNYIITFTAPSLAGSGRNLPNSQRLKFPVLMNVLSRFLHPSQMALISNCYNDFREDKIGRPQLIRRLRSLVGDQMLISVIKLCRDECIVLWLSIVVFSVLYYGDGEE